MSLPDTMVGAAGLAVLLGLSERRIRELRDQGVIPEAGKGQYRLGDAIPAYCAHIRPAAGKGAAGGSEAGSALDQARIEVLNEQRDKLRMLNAQMRGETVLAEDLEMVVGAIVDGVRARILALPTRAAPLVVGLETLAEARDKLTELAHEACGQLASTEIVVSVQDRARRRAGRGSDGDAVAEEAGAAS